MTTENKGLALLKSELPQIEGLIALNAKPGTDVATLAKQELSYLEMHALTKKDILDCEPVTIVQAVKVAIKNNLSLDPSMGLVYITTRSINTGTQATPNWKKALEVSLTANGRLSVNYQCGKIVDHKNPEVEKNRETGKVVAVSFEYQNARGRWEKKTWDESDFERWANASHKQNSRGKADATTRSYANPLYTSFKGGIDPEFARAKAISHGLKKLGTNPMEMRSQAITPVEPKKLNISPEAIEQEAKEIEYAEVIEETPNQRPTTQSTKKNNLPNSSQL